MSEKQRATGSTGKHRDTSKAVDSFTPYSPAYVPRHRRFGPARTCDCSGTLHRFGCPNVGGIRL